ncbi:lysophospholipid acyltransferase family protein [Mucilaginibacter ximonensis]|uniref:Lysophospholipid acyltransferase family protein n=1 Tax=Mucilaginibacter ximonensis TaxID=538021 RepID=A0ABW5Y778_9SPHI
MINKGLSRLGTFFLYLISLLPFWLLYLLADALFVVLYHLIGYRRKVTQENLRNSFPEKSDGERADIERKYYRYLADLMLEIIKMTSISKKQLQRRMVCTNPQWADEHKAAGKSITAVTGHYCNWEWVSLEFSTHTRLFVVYKTLADEVMDNYFLRMRTRFGAVGVPMPQTLKTCLAHKDEFTVSAFAGDQTPPMATANYFTVFLNQPTAVFLGIEKIAKRVDSAVIFCDMRRIKRGYYEYTMVSLIEDAKNTAEYEITEAHTKYLEAMIRREPQYWLWSHKRWKLKPKT